MHICVGDLWLEYTFGNMGFDYYTIAKRTTIVRSLVFFSTPYKTSRQRAIGPTKCKRCRGYGKVEGVKVDV